MPGWSVVEGALGPSFLFGDPSEKVFPWAVLKSTEMGHWTIPSHFQPMIRESKHGGRSRGRRGALSLESAIFPRSSEGQQTTSGVTGVSLVFDPQ